MPIRVPYQTVRIHRDGKNIVPPIGVPFDFTDEEVEAFNKMNDQALRRAINERVGVPVETQAEVASTEEADDQVKIEPTKPPAPTGRHAARRGRAAAAADDEEL